MRLSKEDVKRICFIITFTMALLLVILNIKEIFSKFNVVFVIVSPLIIGACIAFIVNVPMKYVERFLKKYVFKKSRKAPRGTSIALTVTLILIGIFIVIFSVVPQIMTSIGVILPKIPPFFEEATEWVMKYFKDPYIAELIETININWSELGESALGLINEGLSGFFTQTYSLAGSLISSIVTGVLSFVFAIYVLANKENLGRQCNLLMTAYLSEKSQRRIKEVAVLSNQIFSKFISGQCLEAFILGALFFIVLTIFRIPYALLISVLIGVTALIPIVGAFIGCIIGAFLILIESPIQAIVFIIIFLVLQQLEGNLIYPRVVGSSIGLPAIWVLFAVTVGANLWGVTGILFFIPFSAVMYSLLRTATYNRIEKIKGNRKE